MLGFAQREAQRQREKRAFRQMDEAQARRSDAAREQTQDAACVEKLHALSDKFSVKPTARLVQLAMQQGMQPVGGKIYNLYRLAERALAKKPE